MSLRDWKLYPIGDFGRWIDEWDRLADRLTPGNPLLRSDFIQPALDCFATGEERLAVLLAEGRPQAMAILQRASLFTWQLWIPSQLVLGPALLPPDLHPRDLKVLAGRLDPSCLRLLFWRQDPLYSPFGREKERPVPGTMISPYWKTIAVDLAGTFQDYWKSRQRKLRQEVPRKLRKLHNAFQRVDLVVHRDPAEVVDAVDRYGMLESRGWKGRLGTALHPRNQQGRFYREVMRRCATQDAAWVAELWADARLLASRLAIGRDGAMIVALKTTYDEGFKKFGPGNGLLYLLIQYFFQSKPARTLEFYTNADREKSKWATDGRQLFTAEIFRFQWMARIKPTLDELRSRWTLEKAKA